MNASRRKAKRSQQVSNTLSDRLSHYQRTLENHWQALSSRDQLALVVLILFLLLFVGGYGGYSVHQAAKKSQSAYQEQIADYFWLRSQAGNIDPSALSESQDDANAMPPASRVNSILQTSGIDRAQVIAANEGVQLSFNHPSQAVVSAALGKLEQQGGRFSQLSIQQDAVTKQMQVQATIRF